MRQSNTYIIVFTVIMTVIIGGLLSGANQILGPAQKKSIELDTKTQILKAVMKLEEGDDILEIYKLRIRSIVVDYNGDIVEKDEKGNPIEAEKVNVLKNFKKDKENRQLPVFSFVDENDESKVIAYILPTYGKGLWNSISGYIALGADMNTIVGASFGHVQETPGLGARISSDDIQDRFKGKKVYDEAGSVVSVSMQKGEKGGGGAGSIEFYKSDDHKVDGMSGATLTGKGLNAMLAEYFDCYNNYIKKTANAQ